ncbi:MAG: hypothetical protein K2N12_07185 [Helicobacter sp.]|nr:hypothetical protein [Helicobacter sp.]
MTIILNNADSKVLGVIESLGVLKPDMKIKVRGKKPSKKLRKAMKECEQIMANPHLYPSYSSMAELRRALDN